MDKHPKLDPNFKYEVAKRPGGEGILSCFACGTCTGVCPVSEIDKEYAPSKIIRMILWGMKEEVLNSPIIWLCAMCFNCSFSCPQGVNFANCMRVLREMAKEEGYVSSSFLENIEEIDRFTQTLRRDMLKEILPYKKEKKLFSPKDIAKKLIEK